jgi:peptidoglycan/LPS O-acetylase OafA/YrhL
MTKRAQRLLAVDAVRGVAALAVVLYHVPRELRSAVGIQPLLDAIFANGYLGVDSFFVLSGFVITMSVASSSWTFSYLLRFIARRSVRLDPSYWTAIGLELLLGYFGFRILQDEYPFPSTAGVVSHLVYMQGVLGYPQISDVFWTLCFEIQFYLTLVGLLVVSNLRLIRTHLSQYVVLGTVLTLIAVTSVAVRNGVIQNPHEGIALVRAYQFAIGVVTFLAAKGKTSRLTAAMFCGAILMVRLVDGAVAEVCVTALTVGLCFGSISSERLNSLADVLPLQFLGKISYSLYLYHASIVGRASALSLLLAKKTGLTYLPILGLAGAVLGSIAFAYLMFRLIEQPTMRLSKRIRME